MKPLFASSVYLVIAMIAVAAEGTTVVSSVASATFTSESSTITQKCGGFFGTAESPVSFVTSPATSSSGTVKATANEVVEVEAVGYGKTHAEAMADACLQAVSQVCGADVAKAIIAVGKKDLSFSGTAFKGVLLSYQVEEDEQLSDNTYKVEIRAKVKPPIGDMFCDKLGLALPSATTIISELKNGSLSAKTAETLGALIENHLKTMIINDSRFVILDRSSALAQQERKLADSSQASCLENGKADSMKVADFVLELKLLNGKEKMSMKEFKVAKKNKYTLIFEVELELRLVDVATGGIVSREIIPLDSSATSWREETCLQIASEEFAEKYFAILPKKINNLLKKIKAK